MPKFVLTLWDDQTQWGKASPEEMEKNNQAYADVTEEMRSKGAFVAGEGVQPVATAKTVRVRGNKTEATDGPFADTKEQLAGFYLLECKDQNEAIRWGAKIPAAVTGSIDIRPIIDYPQEG
jgi:hypothetical protein